MEFLKSNPNIIIIILLALILLIFIIMAIPKKLGKKNSTPKKHNEILSELSRNSDDVYILFDKDCSVVFVSENIEKTLGIKKEDVFTDIYSLGTIIDRDEQRKITNQFKADAKSGKRSTYEVSVKIKSKEKPSTYKITLYKTDDENHFIMHLADITEEKKIRDGLQEQIVEVMNIDKSKTVFLSNMSHEIRTPMNGMLGMISLAKISQKKGEFEDANNYLEKAEGLTQFLLSIINDILDMTRIESGKLELEVAEFSIKALAEKLRTMFETTITEKGIDFLIKLEDFDIDNVLGDELRISQVIANLLSNASKFTNSGGHIGLTLRQMEKIDGKVSLMIQVKDDGKGMSPEFLSRIFMPFEQEESGIARKYGGSGLGMAISDNLVRQMGGQILVDSAVGKGTEFTIFVELPVAENQGNLADDEVESQTINLEGIRLLMAEDNNINALVATKLLENKKFVIERVENGQECVDTFNNHEKGYYSAILMDVHMPIMDGWEATKEIRKLQRDDAKTIPIIALSADAFVEDKRHSIEIGMNGHVAKPIDYDELQEVLRDCLLKNIQNGNE